MTLSAKASALTLTDVKRVYNEHLVSKIQNWNDDNMMTQEIEALLTDKRGS